MRRLHSLFFVCFSSSSVVELFAKSNRRLSESESYIRLSIAFFLLVYWLESFAHLAAIGSDWCGSSCLRILFAVKLLCVQEANFK